MGVSARELLGHDQSTGLVMDADAIRRALTRVAHEVMERNGGPVLLAGIPTRGVPLARRLQAALGELGVDAAVLELQVEGHRDDRPTHRAEATAGSGEVTGSIVVLVDDVIFHGRTARAALDALTELGRPAAVQLAVLVDRGHRELPIRADFVGKNIPTGPGDRVEVHLAEIDGHDAVVLLRETSGG
ncbi:MAG: bifunctional pyr operon transcriptional regulator/uracil phosphoribosyltransferase PyrR [Candidatus Dormibacteria bacterium]